MIIGVAPNAYRVSSSRTRVRMAAFQSAPVGICPNDCSGTSCRSQLTPSAEVQADAPEPAVPTATNLAPSPMTSAICPSKGTSDHVIRVAHATGEGLVEGKFAVLDVGDDVGGRLRFRRFRRRGRWFRWSGVGGATHQPEHKSDRHGPTDARLVPIHARQYGGQACGRTAVVSAALAPFHDATKIAQPPAQCLPMRLRLAIHRVSVMTKLVATN